jgi:tetratricopeptide (TPR) repeat protein
MQLLTETAIARNQAIYTAMQQQFIQVFTPERCDAIHQNFDELDQERSNWLRAIELSNWDSASRITLGLFEYLHTRGLWQEIEDIWKDLLHKAPNSASSAATTATLLHQLGVIVLNRGRQAEAVGYFEQSLSLARQWKLAQLEANTLYQLAVAQLRHGQYKNCRRLLDEALSAAQHTEDRKLDQYILGQMSNLLTVEGKLNEAVLILEDSLVQWQTLIKEPERLLSHTTLHALGRIRLRQRRFAEAQYLLQESLRLKRKTGAPREGIAHTICLLGEVYARLNHFTKAESYLLESIQDCLERGDLRYLVLGRKALGCLRLKQQQFSDAEVIFAQALADAVRTANPELKLETGIWHMWAAMRCFRLKNAVRGLSIALSGFRESQFSFLTLLKLTVEQLKHVRTPWSIDSTALSGHQIGHQTTS